MLTSSTHLQMKNARAKRAKVQFFYCQICKFLGVLLPSSSWLLKGPCKRSQHCWPTRRNIVCKPSCVLLRVVATCWMKFKTGQTSEPSSPNISIVSWSAKRGPTMLRLKIWSSHLLDNLSNCLMNLKNSGDSTRFEPMTSAMPVQCSNQLSYEVTQWRAGQFVGLMFSRERNVIWKKCYMQSVKGPALHCVTS